MTDIANQPSSRGADWNIADDNRNIKEKASTAKDAVSDLAGEAKRYATHRVGDVRQSAGEWADSAKNRAAEYGGIVSDFVQKNPYKTLAIAAGAGLLLGMMLKRR